MKKIFSLRKNLLTLFLLLFISKVNAEENFVRFPQSVDCIQGNFNIHSNSGIRQVNLSLINQCSYSIDMQKATVNFLSNEMVNTFAYLDSTESKVKITSQPSKKGYSVSFSLHFSNQSSTKILAPKQSLKISYEIPLEKFYEFSTVKVYLANQSLFSGKLKVTNNQDLSNFSHQQPLFFVKNKTTGKIVQISQLNGAQSQVIDNLQPGTYLLLLENLASLDGNLSYQGQVHPSEIQIQSNHITPVDVSFIARSQQQGAISIKVGKLPIELTGYAGHPEILLTETETNTFMRNNIAWNHRNTVTSLKSNVRYQVSATDILYQGKKCIADIHPTSLMSNHSTVQLNYHCVPAKQKDIEIRVEGLPENTDLIQVTLAPADNSPPILTSIPIEEGKGKGQITISEGTVYQVSATKIPAYQVVGETHIYTAEDNSNLTLQYSSNQSGKLIGYLPGWISNNLLPSPTALKEAGYTHILVAFGVFSTTMPGEVVSAFPAITKEYIASLHNVGIKVLLSLGGASSNIPNTTANFHEVRLKATSATQFKQTMKNSLYYYMKEYGFDGFDVDIEHGLIGEGSFANPEGDIKILAEIINEMHATNPNLLISLAPQTANIGATSKFDGVWGNYASLIMQTAPALSWVGMQLYNTGCIFGIDQICYENQGGINSSFSVAMAVNLLEDWPSQIKGQSTGFQPYVSYLRPDQVVLGYPAPNSLGHSDGAPTTSISAIKNAINCLKTGNMGCNDAVGYMPPNAYSEIGGVFNWEVTYDQNNGFKFAKNVSSR